jgi:hypothetical protein
MAESAGQSESLSAHRLALARELIDDLELNRVAPEALLLKASRLARLVDSPKIQEWLRLELQGYSDVSQPVAREYATLTGRLTEPTNMVGYWQPFAGLLGVIRAMEAEVSGLRIPDIQFSLPPVDQMGGVWTQTHVQAATAPVANVMERLSRVTGNIAKLRTIVSKILGLLHEFVSTTYYGLAFRGLAESIFESHQKQIDTLLAKVAGTSLEKIPAITQRLSEGDPEAISQAMTTGRRVLAAFADAIQPPQQETLNLDGKQVEATGEKYLNRLHYFIVNNCNSDRRKQRLRDMIVHLNTRFGAAVHADVTAEEARALFVLLYVTLGEILSLKMG